MYGTSRQRLASDFWWTVKVIAAVAGTWFLAVPQIPLAWKAPAGLAGINVAVLSTGAALAVAAVLADAQLTRTLLEDGRRPGLWHTMGIITTSLGVSRAVPAGAAVGTFTAFRLLERAGVERSRAAFTMTTRSVGSAIVLNALLWIALVLTLPRYGFATSYLLAIAAGAAVLLAGAVATDALLRRRSWLWASAPHIARVVPKLEPGTVTRQLDDQSAQLVKLASRPSTVRKAFAWAVANWLIDAAALWVFLAAFGVTMSPAVVLAAFALANLAAAIPITPGGLGLVEVTLAVTLTSFGAPPAATVLGIAAYRVFNYWLPIPASILSYLAVRRIKTPLPPLGLGNPSGPLETTNASLSGGGPGNAYQRCRTNNGPLATASYSTSKQTGGPVMHIGTIRNLFYLPMTILYVLVGIPLSLAMVSIPRKRFATIHQSHQEKEIERRLDDAGSFVNPGDSLLDVGCGNGQFGEALAREFGADVRGVDVLNYANSDIPIGIYDGVNLPFEDDSFDVVVMAMMLHHVEHQEELFDEAIRCSRRGLIIYEDTYFSSWQRLAVIWNDFYSNMIYGVIKISKGLEGKGVLKMPLPFTFRSVEEWNDLFANKRLANKGTVVHHLGIKPHSKVTFLLEKS